MPVDKETEDFARHVAKKAKIAGGFADAEDYLYQQSLNVISVGLRYTTILQLKKDEEDGGEVSQLVVKNFRQERNMHDSITPNVLGHSASSIRNRPSQQRKYEETILARSVAHGAFVSVKSYVHFCISMMEMTAGGCDLKPSTYSIIQEDISRGFRLLPKTGMPFEMPRSLQLSRILQMELGTSTIQWCHQVPILPFGKDRSQEVDVGCLVRLGLPNRSYVAATIVYKPSHELEYFDVQSRVYGTDAMHISRRPCISVQVSGMDMAALTIRAVGIVKNPEKEGPKHAASLLLHASGLDGLKKLVFGLKGYLQYYPEEGETWMRPYLSNVVSMHESERLIYKAYDYRNKGKGDTPTSETDRRKPNIELVRKFVDPEAKLYEIDSDFSILSTNLYMRRDGKQWWDPVSCKKVSKILRALVELHKDGFVHGDIRLNNMILHEGVLIDFDFARKHREGRYPSTLQDLTTYEEDDRQTRSDGKRANAVSRAIQEEEIFWKDYHGDDFEYRNARGAQSVRLKDLPMDKSHDEESMRYVLSLLKPIDSQKVATWNTILALGDLQSMIDPMDQLGCDVEVCIVSDGTMPKT